ncbi:MAG: hypothetical protein V2A64_02700 [Candidatus Omnitrophota bacterium]
MKFSVDIGGYIIVLGLGVGIVFLVMKMIKYQLRSAEKKMQDIADKQAIHVLDENIQQAIKKGDIVINEDNSLKLVKMVHCEEIYLSPYFITDAEKMECVLEKPYILIYEKKISAVNDIIPLLEKTARQKKSLLIITEIVEAEALTTLVINKMTGTLDSCPVRLGQFDERKKIILEDVAVLTGGRVITQNMGITLENIDIEDLGRAEKVKVDKENIIIIGFGGKPAKINRRIEQIKRQFEKSNSFNEKKLLQERLGRLSGKENLVLNVKAIAET